MAKSGSNWQGQARGIVGIGDGIVRTARAPRLDTIIQKAVPGLSFGHAARTFDLYQYAVFERSLK
jgi:hypothetical protein